MGAFKAAIDHLCLKEIKLNGRRFTWSNQQNSPTLTRIDWFLCTNESELIFSACFLHSLPSLMSGHTPLLLQAELDHHPNTSFHFKNFWTKMEGFHELVQAFGIDQSALSYETVTHQNGACGESNQTVEKEKIGDTRLQLAIVKEVLLWLEAAQEHRLLTDQEVDLCRRLKARSMGLAAIEKTRIKQRSRLTYIRCGDTNTKIFHIRASARRRKNYIHCLHTDVGMAIAHEEKEKVIRDYFNDHLGSVIPRSTTINRQSLGYSQQDLSELEVPFSVEEVQNIIKSMPSDKATFPRENVVVLNRDSLQKRLQSSYSPYGQTQRNLCSICFNKLAILCKLFVTPKFKDKFECNKHLYARLFLGRTQVFIILYLSLYLGMTNCYQSKADCRTQI